MTNSRLIGPCDSLSSALRQRLRSLPGQAAEVVVFRPTPRRPGLHGFDLDALQATFAELAAKPPRTLVLISSAAASPPSHHHPGFVAEDVATRPSQHPIAKHWLELETRARELCPATTRLLILRSAAVLAPDSTELFPRLLRRRLVFPAWGFDPTIQLLSREDFVDGVVAAIEAGLSGTYHLANERTVPLRQALRAAGAWRLPLPSPLLVAARAVARALGRASEPAEVDSLCYIATVDSRRLARDAGFTPTRSSLEAARSLRGRPHRAGESEPDDYGMSPRYIAAYGRTLFRFLHRLYWRIEVKGLEQVPTSGRALLVGVHRGLMPWDGVMTLHTLATAIGRFPRFLIHPCLAKFSYLANYMTKLGGVIACQENADRLLSRDELLGYYPEGIRGAFTMYKDAYRLRKFGRDDFVKAALRSRSPIVPFVTLGSAEIYPILGRIDWPWWKRTSEWLFFPLTPTFPWLPIPLPSKWHIEFLERIDLPSLYPPEAADDPELVHAISADVRARMQTALDALRARRLHIFWGSVFATEEDASGETAVARPRGR